jgi:hypothetical protein
MDCAAFAKPFHQLIHQVDSSTFAKFVIGRRFLILLIIPENLDTFVDFTLSWWITSSTARESLRVDR